MDAARVAASTAADGGLGAVDEANNRTQSPAFNATDLRCQGFDSPFKRSGFVQADRKPERQNRSVGSDHKVDENFSRS